MLLFRLITCVHLLPIYGIHNLSKISLSSPAIILLTIAITSDVKVFDRLDVSELLELMSMLARLYLVLWGPKSMSSISMEVLMTLVLLIWAKQRYQKKIHFFWLKKCVRRLWPVIAIAFSSYANPRIKKFRFFLTLLMIFFFISVIVSWLL